jgi:DNA primase
MITLADAIAHGHGTERSFNCPVHGDEHPSASVNIVKGKWFCYRCHASGTVDGAVYDTLPEEDLLSAVREALDDHTVGGYPESWLDQFDVTPCLYWLGRFEPATVAHFRLGYDHVKDAATYPLRKPDGSLIGVVRRPLADQKTRYKYPWRARTSRLLFNFSSGSTETVVLTEGATDAMAAWEVCLDEDVQLPLASFSNRLSSAQAALIDRIAPRRIILAFDNDKAGREGTVQARALLSMYDLYTVRLGSAKDLAELAPSQRVDVLEHPVAL